MDVRSLEYAELAARILTDSPGVRESVTGATLHFDRSRIHGYAGIDVEAWRRWAEGVKSHLLTHLDRYLEEATRNLEANGATVHWAATAQDARDVVRSLLTRHGIQRAVKAKSMLSEELEINELLEHEGVEVFETDLGEYILQLLREPPSHILGPAIHRGIEEIRSLFHERFGTPLDASPDALASAARKVLRSAFLTADLGITGGNFLVADTGTLALIENEGNIRLSTSLPRVHVALVGIEKLLPRWTDLAPFLQLTSRAATGQTVGTFVSLVQAPRTGRGEQRAMEPDGPEELHIIFIDNGRTKVLADPQTWEVLRCVRCGACLNTCPVYRQTGGHAYGWVYSGPLGAVLNPGLLGLGQSHPLPFASTLCGACYDACPVRIPIPKLLLEWRARAVEADLRPNAERRMMRAFADAAVRPKLFLAAGKALALMPGPLRRKLPVLRQWAKPRTALDPAVRSFMERWRRESRKMTDAIPVTESAPDSATPLAGAAHAPHQAAPETATPPKAVARNEDLPSMSEPPSQPGPRRAFAAGSLGPLISRSGTPPVLAPTENAVLKGVHAALAGRTRIAHPGPLAAADTIAGAANNARQNDRGDETSTTVTGFVAQFRANGGEVVQFAGVQQAGEWLRGFAREVGSAVVSLLVPPELSPHTYGSAAAPPETATLGVSMAIAAAAGTGTLLLDSRERRAIQLLPPVHLVWLPRSRINSTLGDALDSVRYDLPAALGLHSGPSKSADIGRVIVTGVHGPGRVIAALIP